MAPEVFEEKYSMKADSWSVGCVVYQMVTGSPPWKSLGYTNPVSLFNYMQNIEGPPSMDIAEEEEMIQTVTGIQRIEMIRNLVKRCFARNPDERPTAKEMLDDPFFAEDHIWEEADQSDCCSLFSPVSSYTPLSKASPIVFNVSPIVPTSHRPGSNGRSAFLSPPLAPRLKGNLKSLSPISPMVDASGWPTWARDKHSQQNRLKHSKHSNQDTICSLERSDDSTQSEKAIHATSTPECKYLSSGSGSSLKGLAFIENSKR
jgi:serine/threonine protein kinase